MIGVPVCGDAGEAATGPGLGVALVIVFADIADIPEFWNIFDF
jgi:hypothetical protein